MRRKAAGIALVVATLTLGACSESDDGGAQIVSTEAPEAPTTTARPTTTLAPYTPTPADFAVEIIELRRACFGSAGCNVTYRINPSYVGTRPPARDADYTILYEVTGGETPLLDNFTLVGDQFEFRAENTISTPADVPLAATVTRVLEN